MQIAEILEGSGYQNNSVCPEARQIGLEREDYWMETLRTTFSYGINERIRQCRGK